MYEPLTSTLGAAAQTFGSSGDLNDVVRRVSEAFDPHKPFRVPVKIRGRDILMLVDTGATTLGLPRDVVRALQLTPTSSRSVMSAAGRREFPCIDDLEIEVLGQSMRTDAIVIEGVPVLGYKQLAALNLLVDARNGKLRPGVGEPAAWLSALSTEPYATGTLDDLVPEVRVQVDALIAEATKRGFKPKVRSVGRTCEQQDEQKKLGYSQAGLCRSMHVLGHAVDLDLSPNACSTYTALGQWWEARGGVWGGRWTQFGACGDAGHFHWGFDKAQAVPTKLCPADVTLAQCRTLREDYISKAKASARGSSGEKSYNVLAVGTFAVVGVLAAVAYFGRPS